jgi:hypothetical protein
MKFKAIQKNSVTSQRLKFPENLIKLSLVTQKTWEWNHHVLSTPEEHTTTLGLKQLLWEAE